MPEFMVSTFEGGIWDDTPPRQVEARDEKDAAELVCGEPLLEGAKPGDLRASVRPIDAPERVKVFRRAPCDFH